MDKYCIQYFVLRDGPSDSETYSELFNQIREREIKLSGPEAEYEYYEMIKRCKARADTNTYHVLFKKQKF